MQITLTVIDGPHCGLVFKFDRHDTFLVGRSSYAHFRLPSKDRYCSRVHFLMEVNPPYCRLVDLGSHNGTFVNGQKVLMADLHHGDQIRAGRNIIQLAVEQEPGEVPSVDLAPGESQVPVLPLLPGYRCLRELGRGDLGIVYLAQRSSDAAEVALKIIPLPGQVDPPQLARFLEELRFLRLLQHPGIVNFLDQGEYQGWLYFAQEYVPGQDAARLVQAEGPLAAPRAVNLIIQVLEALEYAHAGNYVHRALKPSKVLVTSGPTGEVAKITDFGPTRLYQASQLSGLPVTGPRGGTAAFLPPEQISNYHLAAATVDQYAVAGTFYFLLTGHSPYDVQGDFPHQAAQILHRPPTPILARRPDLPGQLAAVIHKGLARQPEKRFPSVADFRLAILQATSGGQ